MYAYLSCPILCDPIDCSPPGSSVHGTFQARILEWVVIFSSRGSSDLGMKFESPVSPVLAGSEFTNCVTWEAPSFWAAGWEGIIV